MGCDGGSIPRRDEMVKLKKKAEKAEKDIALAAKWRHCAISAEKLCQPIVACELGRLYNKEALLMGLLDRANLPENASHIRSLKDIYELNLTPNPSYKDSEKYTDAQSAQYICPVTGLEMSGHHNFCFIRTCGCAISEKALKEVPSETCHKCAKSFVKDDVIILNGTEEDVKKMAEKMEERRKQAKLSKRKRKAVSQQVEQESTSDGCSSGQTSGSSDNSPPESIALPKLPEPDSAQKLPGPVAGAAESKSTVKKPKITAGKPSMAVYPPPPSSDKSKSHKKKSKGLESRDAYRSLFTSSAPARPKEQTSNWVTFFPYH